MAKAKAMNYKSLDALQPIVKVINEAEETLNDKDRTIGDSAIPDILGGALGAGIGGVGSYTALWGLGTVGFSARGITSALKTLGRLVGGGMKTGVFVVATPIVALAVGGTVLAGKINRKQLRQEKERLLSIAVARLHAIIDEQKTKINNLEGRADLLNKINIVLLEIIKNLRSDLGLEVE